MLMAWLYLASANTMFLFSACSRIYKSRFNLVDWNDCYCIMIPITREQEHGLHI